MNYLEILMNYFIRLHPNPHTATSGHRHLQDLSHKHPLLHLRSRLHLTTKHTTWHFCHI